MVLAMASFVSSMVLKDTKFNYIHIIICNNNENNKEIRSKRNKKQQQTTTTPRKIKDINILELHEAHVPRANITVK